MLDLSGMRFGIEIEANRNGRSDRQIALAMIAAMGAGAHEQGTWSSINDGRGRSWALTYDGSIGTGGVEIVSPVLTAEDLPMLQAVVRAVRRVGCCVDSRCGIHVHVDGSRFDGPALARLVKIVGRQEALIMAALGESRINNRYCRTINAAFLEAVGKSSKVTLGSLRRLWYESHGYGAHATPSRYNATRYHGVNLNSMFHRGTVEFRWFASTLHAGRVKAYVQFVLALAARAMSSKRAAGGRRNVEAASTRYLMRTFLLRLGLIGPDFATCRKHMLGEKLTGDSAFRGGRAQRAAVVAGARTEVANG